MPKFNPCEYIDQIKSLTKLLAEIEYQIKLLKKAMFFGKFQFIQYLGQYIYGKIPIFKGKSSKIAKIWQKMKKNQFFVFRAPVFAEKRRIEKKRRTKILRFGGIYSGDLLY